MDTHDFQYEAKPKHVHKTTFDELQEASFLTVEGLDPMLLITRQSKLPVPPLLEVNRAPPGMPGGPL